MSFSKDQRQYIFVLCCHCSQEHYLHKFRVTNKIRETIGINYLVTTAKDTLGTHSPFALIEAATYAWLTNDLYNNIPLYSFLKISCMKMEI